MNRVARAAYWIAPSLFCLALYWLGLKVWFQQDDFAWLSLNDRLRESGDLWGILFSPRAQGTFRPLSERAFFLVLHGLFGMDALPFRVVVFATQFANLVMVSWLALRLTASRPAGLLAPILWISSGTLATVMSWTSSYNQVLVAFFLLAAFQCLLRYLDTGMRRFLALQWLFFLLGFGALEIMVVYPAVAAAYVLLAARKHWRTVAWLFVPSGVYTALHWHFAPKAVSGPYAMHWTSSILGTFWTYWGFALGPAHVDLASVILPQGLTLLGTLAITCGLVALIAWQVRRRDFRGLFLFAWFVLMLAPVLPLRDHISDYYLTTPMVGLAVLGAWGVAEAWRSKWAIRAAALVLLAVYLASSLPVARAVTRWNYQQSRASRNLVNGLIRARELHPDKIILLTGLPSDLFWGTIYHKAHWLAGVHDMYLTPGSDDTIEAHPELAAISEYVLPSSVAIRALEENRAVVYSASEARLRNVTAVLQATARTRWGDPELPFRVEAGNPLFTGQLGPTWHPIEGAYRWMPKQATVLLHGPTAAGQKLYLSGFCAAQLVKSKPLTVTVSVDHAVVGRETLTKPDSPFDLVFPLPAAAVGKPQIEVGVEVSHTFVAPSDGRELGLVFGTLSIR